VGRERDAHHGPRASSSSSSGGFGKKRSTEDFWESSAAVEMMAHGSARTLWRASFPFSCGPAALGSVRLGLGWRPPRDRRREEIEIWRESTAVAGPGAHPFGLALAPRRRGSSTRVSVSGPHPWLASHARVGCAISQRGGEYVAFERPLATQCRDHRLSILGPGPPPRSGAAGLLRVTAREKTGAKPDPHSTGRVPSSRAHWVADPLRTELYRSNRSTTGWWKGSGFETTRNWVAIRPSTHPSVGGASAPRGRIPTREPPRRRVYRPRRMRA
jgi:hypothetical protein